MFLQDYKIRARRAVEFFNDSIEIYIFHRPDPGGPARVLTDLTFTEVQPQTALNQETIQLPGEVAQQLMDSLWDCGVRPSEGNGSAGAMKAAQDHIKDLQGSRADLQQTLARSLGIVERLIPKT